MKKIEACFVLMLFASSALAEDGHCSLATLRGTYGFATTGTDSSVPFSTSGMESYDGLGNIKYTQLWHEGGVDYTYNGTGKIVSITSNCIAKVVYDGNTSHVWTYFVAPDGTGFYSNNNQSGGYVESAGFERRMTYTLLELIRK